MYYDAVLSAKVSAWYVLCTTVEINTEGTVIYIILCIIQVSFSKNVEGCRDVSAKHPMN